MIQLVFHTRARPVHCTAAIGTNVSICNYKASHYNSIRPNVSIHNKNGEQQNPNYLMYYDWPDYSGLPFSLVEHTSRKIHRPLRNLDSGHIREAGYSCILEQSRTCIQIYWNVRVRHRGIKCE